MLKKVSKLNKGLKGYVTIPADKSISHRAVMFASLANGKSVIKNFSNGADPLSSLSVFSTLGVKHEFINKNTLVINSNGNLNAPSDVLNCGNSGTTMRLISGILAGQNFKSVLCGDESLSKRPMKRIITPLQMMGAQISSVDGHAPLEIFGQTLHGIDYVSPIASAQVKSCVLLAGLKAGGVTTFSEPYLSRNHTELLLKYMGAEINSVGTCVKISKSELQPKHIEICGDISSAAFFIAAGLIVPDSDIILKDVGLNSTRTGILDVAKSMGGDVEILDKDTVSGEVKGDIRIRYSKLKGCIIEKDIIPRLIDELPIIAVMASLAEGQTIVKDAQDLRNKESDRIAAVVSELRKLGAEINETSDGFVIYGKKSLKGGTQVKSYHDHRLAMSLYVAGLVCDETVAIDDFEWVSISFPNFEFLLSNLIA